MRHIPHLVVPPPWDGPVLTPSPEQWRHLTTVLRVEDGEPVTYTDGAGTIGSGTIGDETIERGSEDQVQRTRALTMAVAPPSNKNRQRFVVEKLAELGVSRLLWLTTQHGANRAPNPAKVSAWILSATEQSRGAFVMGSSDEMVTLGGLEGEIVVCHPGGGGPPQQADVVAIGPEGGFDEDEMPESARRWDLGPTVLRVETAAVAAASRLII